MIVGGREKSLVSLKRAYDKNKRACQSQTIYVTVCLLVLFLHPFYNKCTAKKNNKCRTENIESIGGKLPSELQY